MDVHMDVLIRFHMHARRLSEIERFIQSLLLTIEQHMQALCVCAGDDVQTIFTAVVMLDAESEL